MPRMADLSSVGRRPLVAIGIVVGVAAVAAVAVIAVVLLTRRNAPPTQPVSWTLVFLNGDPETTRSLAVYEHWHSCDMGTTVRRVSRVPVIAYATDTVTITMPSIECVPCPDGINCAYGSTSPGIPTGLTLSEPLDRRLLFDGSRSPSALRPYH